jgi:hypothetical protein
MRQVAVAPLLPQIRIGERLGVSELKRPLAKAGKPLLRPFLVSFADRGESHAGSAVAPIVSVESMPDYRRCRQNRITKAAISRSTPAAGSGVAKFTEPPAPA